MKVELRLSGLEVRYGDLTALSCPELKVEGAVVAVLGHNGAGKSTLIKAVLELLPWNSGFASAIECETQRRLVPELDMAFCPESGAVFEDISVEDYVRFWCRVKYRDGRYYKKDGSAVIEMLELSPLLKRLGRELSKGQRRRVQTAIGFLIKPKLFLFDEPFDGLDVQKTNELAKIIRQYSPQMASLLSSHRMDVMERLADVFLVLKHGQVAAFGDLPSVVKALCPQSFVVSGLMHVENQAKLLAQSLPEAVVNCLGSEIQVSGRGLSEIQLKTLVGEEGALIRSARPSLTDAMDYHLKTIACTHS